MSIRMSARVESAELILSTIEAQATRLGDPTAALRAAALALREYLEHNLIIAREEGAADLAKSLRQASAPLAKVIEALARAEEG